MNPRRRHKSIKIIRKLSLNQSGIPEDSLEADFLLESHCRDVSQCEKSFLEEVSLIHKPVYKEDGTINKREVVGPIEILDRSQRPSMVSRSSTLLRRFNRPMLKSTKKDYLAVYKNKIAQIKAGEKRGRAQEKEKQSKMNIGQRIEYSKDKRRLQNYRKMSQNWNTVSVNIAKEVRRDSSCLVMNSGYEWRKRKEAIDYIDRITPIHEKLGNTSWYGNLRKYDNEQSAEEFIHIGHMFSGLYARSKPVPNYPREIIFKDSETANNLLEKTKLYMEKVNASCLQLRKNVLSKSLPIEVHGSNKLKMEKDAAWNVGISNIDPFLVPPPCPEEVIASNYQGWYKIL